MNKFLKCHNVLGLTCIKKTAKQEIPHQLINLFCSLIFVKHNKRHNAPKIVVGQIYEYKLTGIFLPNIYGTRKDVAVTKIAQSRYIAKYTHELR
jgi:hypothetical protein